MKKLIAIIGGGESGVGAALLAKQEGYDVIVSDHGKLIEKYKNILIQNEIPFEEEGHNLERLKRAFLVIKSPGVPGEALIVRQLTRHQLPVISEIEFANRFYDGTIIAITGSNGKTTTSGLIFHLLKEANLNVGVAGNIGNSFAGELVNKPHKDIMVLEISNFQLDDIIDFSPDISILLNISPDHLDRYGYDFEKYIHTKFKITNKQKNDDVFIYNSSDSNISKYVEEYFYGQQLVPISYYYFENGVINFDTDQAFETQLLGKHNDFNIQVAVAVARLLELSESVIAKGLLSFKPVEHRLEWVRKIGDIDYYNDSKATNIDAVYYALQAMDKKLVWIVGGVDKGNDYSVIEELVRDKVKAMICLSVDNEKLIGAFSPIVNKISETTSMSEAVELASSYAENDDIVLLSPACASFDLFKNYKDRGLQFKDAVFALDDEGCIKF